MIGLHHGPFGSWFVHLYDFLFALLLSITGDFDIHVMLLELSRTLLC